MATQLVLGMQLPQSATLDAFVGTANAALKASVAALVATDMERLFIHGPPATGKTHLLQAACRAAGDAGLRSAYLPMQKLGTDAAAFLDGLESMDCVCIDDIDAIAGDRDTEIALVSLSDGLRSRGNRLLAAGSRPPADLGLALGDLASRLAWGGVQAAVPLEDADKHELLLHRAAQRGMDMPDATAAWLLRHGERDIRSLMTALDTLDEASLAAHRRLTIPFVKQALALTG